MESAQHLNISSVVAFLMQLCIAGMFLFSAISKAVAPDDARGLLAVFVGNDGSGWLVFIVIVLECILATLLLAGLFVRTVFWMCAVVVACGTIVLAVARLTGYDHPCGCFGRYLRLSDAGEFARNGMVLALLGAGMLFTAGGKTPERPLRRQDHHEPSSTTRRGDLTLRSRHEHRRDSDRTDSAAWEDLRRQVRR